MTDEIRNLIIENQENIFHKIVAEKLNHKISNIEICVNTIRADGKLWFNYKYNAIWDDYSDKINGGMYLNK